MAVALGVFSAARFYTVSWLGERSPPTSATPYRACLAPKPRFLRTTQTGRVLVRPDGRQHLRARRGRSSLSMGLRNAVWASAPWPADRTNPYGWCGVGTWCWWCCPACGSAGGAQAPRAAWIACRLERHRAEVLNAIPVVQAITAESRGPTASMRRRQRIPHRLRRKKARSDWWPSSSCDVRDLLGGSIRERRSAARRHTAGNRARPSCT